MAVVSVAANSITYGVSGYLSNATIGNVKTHNVIGVVDNAVDNSGGSAGDLTIDVIVNRQAVFEVDTTGTPTQAQQWTNVTLDSFLVADEDDEVDTDTGLIKMRKLVDATNKKVDATINYSSPADA